MSSLHLQEICWHGMTLDGFGGISPFTMHPCATLTCIHGSVHILCPIPYSVSYPHFDRMLLGGERGSSPATSYRNDPRSRYPRYRDRGYGHGTGYRDLTHSGRLLDEADSLPSKFQGLSALESGWADGEREGGGEVKGRDRDGSPFPREGGPCSGRGSAPASDAEALSHDSQASS